MPAALCTPSLPFADPARRPYAWTTRQGEDLVRIFDAGMQVVRWQRRADPAITACLQQAAASGALGSGFRTAVAAGQRVDPALLPDGPDRLAVIDDIHGLSSLYSDLLGCPAVGLRLEVLRHAMCPRFHVDRTGIRLTCAYLGPGTEWIDDAGVDRDRLGRGSNGLPDHASGLFDRGTAVEAASPFDVVLLKGTLWPDNAARGAIHRSPAVPVADEPRILLAMDAIWN